MTANQKGVGGGLQENNLNVQKHIIRKQSISGLPYPLGTLVAQLAHKLTTMAYAKRSVSH